MSALAALQGREEEDESDMISEMKPIDKELFSPYFEKWEAIRETIALKKIVKHLK